MLRATVADTRGSDTVVRLTRNTDRGWIRRRARAAARAQSVKSVRAPDTRAHGVAPPVRRIAMPVVRAAVGVGTRASVVCAGMSVSARDPDRRRLHGSAPPVTSRISWICTELTVDVSYVNRRQLQAVRHARAGRRVGSGELMQIRLRALGDTDRIRMPPG